MRNSFFLFSRPLRESYTSASYRITPTALFYSTATDWISTIYDTPQQQIRKNRPLRFYFRHFGG